MKFLVLGLGNDLLADDAVGIQAVRSLASELSGKADCIESGLHGVALIDLFIGYDRAIIIDAIQTGNHPPGTILEMVPDDLKSVPSPSPHYTGLPEMIELARQMRLHFPHEIHILAVEVSDVITVGGSMSPPVARAIGDLGNRIREYVDRWSAETTSAES
jgi:hydrogenase maturation protease